MRLISFLITVSLLLVSCGGNNDLSFEIPDSCKFLCKYKQATAVYKEVAYSEHFCLYECLVDHEEASFCGCTGEREKYNNCMLEEFGENYKVAAVWFNFPSSELDQKNYAEVEDYCEYDFDDFEDCLTNCRQ